MRTIYTCIAVLLAVCSTSVGTISLVNLSFEDGLTGWSTYIPPGASITTVQTHQDWWGTGVTSWTPFHGSWFALLKTDGPYDYVRLYQTFTADKGDVLSFAYFWDSRDYIPFNDYATGSIVYGDDPSAPAIATLFYESVATDPQSYWGTPWKRVHYTFPATWTYTLVFSIANGGDPILDSYLGIDAIPAPGAFLLCGIGTAAVGWIRRRKAMA